MQVQRFRDDLPTPIDINPLFKVSSQELLELVVLNQENLHITLLLGMTKDSLVF